MSKSKNYTFIMGFAVSVVTFSPYAVAELKSGSPLLGKSDCIYKQHKSPFVVATTIQNPITQAPAGKATKAF